MITLADHSRCTGCAACYSACGHGAIQMVPDRDGFLYPVVNTASCVDCGKCRMVCPILHTCEDNEDLKICYAARAQDDRLRGMASSGGIFPLLAECVIHDGGVVYGCAWSDQLMAAHTRCETWEDCVQLFGSKYLQSAIGETFRQVKADLDQEKKVLFAGTPCQVAGLKGFLRGKCSSLLTCEVFCHGVPAPGVWQCYWKKTAEKIGIVDMTKCRISFRDKSESWANYKLSFTDGNVCYRSDHSTDLFMNAFLMNLSLRPSCYHCPFKSGKSGADISIGDFWGIENVLPEMDDDKGISAVLLHTEKAKRMFAELLPKTILKTVVLQNIITCNPCYCQAVALPKKHELFMRRYRMDDWGKLLRRCSMPSLWKRIQSKIARILCNLK